MGTPERPHQITPPAPREERRGRSAKERSRNRLTINYISDGTMQPRCELRPKDDQAKWVLEHRPNHIAFHLEMFEECINTPTCAECKILRKANA